MSSCHHAIHVSFREWAKTKNRVTYHVVFSTPLVHPIDGQTRKMSTLVHQTKNQTHFSQTRKDETRQTPYCCIPYHGWHKITTPRVERHNFFRLSYRNSTAETLYRCWQALYRRRGVGTISSSRCWNIYPLRCGVIEL